MLSIMSNKQIWVRDGWFECLLLAVLATHLFSLMAYLSFALYTLMPILVIGNLGFWGTVVAYRIPVTQGARRMCAFLHFFGLNMAIIGVGWLTPGNQYECYFGLALASLVSGFLPAVIYRYIGK